MLPSNSTSRIPALSMLISFSQLSTTFNLFCRYTVITLYPIIFITSTIFSMSERHIETGRQMRAREFTLRMIKSLLIYQTTLHLLFVTGRLCLGHLLRWLTLNAAVREKVYYTSFLQITTTEVEDFKLNLDVPCCQLLLQWTGSNEVKPLLYRVTLKGARPPKDFFRICHFPQAAGERSICQVYFIPSPFP